MEAGPEGGEEGQAGQGDGLTERSAPAGADTDPGPPPDRAASPWLLALPYALAATTALLLTRAYWLPGSYVVGFDTFAYSGPHLEVTERAVRDLRIPLINDTIFGGVPQLGNPQAGVWYPAHLLLQLFETNRAMNLAVAAHAVLLAVGMVVLARRLGIGRLGATLAGCACVGSGAMLAKTTQFEQILSVAWAPLLLAAIHATLTGEGRAGPPIAATAVTTAATLTAGHPQLAYQTAFLALAATVGFAVGGERWRRLPRLAGGVAIGLLLAAPALVASLAAAGDSALDVGRSFDDLRNPALSVETDHLLRALVGTPQAIDPALFAGGSESIGFIGVAVALLAVVGAVRSVAGRDSRPWAIALSVLAVLATVWSTGPRSPVFRIAYDVVPGFDLARGSGRWLTTVAIVGALFAGIGVQAIADRAVDRRDVMAAVAAIAAAVLGVVTAVFETFAGRTSLIWLSTALLVAALIAIAAAATGRVRALGRSVAAAPLVAAVVVAILVVELGAMSRDSLPQQLRTDVAFTSHRSTVTDSLIGRAGYTVAFTDDGRDVDYLVPGLRPNTNSLLAIDSIDGYDGGVQVTDRWATTLYRFTEDPFPDLPMRNSMTVPVDAAVMARLNVRFMLLDVTRGGDFFLDGWEGPLAIDRDFWVYENPSWIGEAIAWPAAEAVPSDRAAADLLRTDADRVRNTALVDDPDAALDCRRACRPTGLAIDERTPEHLVVRTDLDAPSVLSVPRQALAGWSVRVDGRDARELTVDGLFLGVEVPAGEHVVDWRYRSPFLTPSLIMALLAGLAVVALLIPWHTVAGGRRATGGAPHHA